MVKHFKYQFPKDVVSVAVHGGGGTDPYKYQYYTNLNSAFAITGYPTAILNRRVKWGESTSELNSELTKYAPLGLAIESSSDGVNATGKVNVKFNVTTDQTMKIVVALVENGLVYPQTNYYSPSGGSYTANSSNSYIVAYVMDATTANRGVYNVQKTKVGVTQNFN